MLLIVATPPAGSYQLANYCNEAAPQERQLLTNVRFDRDDQVYPFLHKFKAAGCVPQDMEFFHGELGMVWQ